VRTRAAISLSCLVTAGLIFGLGSPAGSDAGTEELRAQPLGLSAVTFQQDVLVLDPAGKGRGISAPSLALPGGFRYQARARFLPEKIDKERREDFVRTITLYEWRGRPGTDCSSVACWVATADFPSSKNNQEQFFDLPKDTKWLVAVWQLPPKTPEGESPPPVATCQDRGCWKIEDVKGSAEGGLSFGMETAEQTTTLTVVRVPKGK
jgi:hypothetical protein